MRQGWRLAKTTYAFPVCGLQQSNGSRAIVPLWRSSPPRPLLGRLLAGLQRHLSLTGAGALPRRPHRRGSPAGKLRKTRHRLRRVASVVFREARLWRHAQEMRSAVMLEASVIATPGQARPFAVQVRARGAVVRSEPVESRSEADRVLLRLLQDAAGDWTAQEI